MPVISSSEVLRLSRTAERVRTLNAETTAERERRDRLVRELIDRGEKWRTVARASGMSIGGLARIMGRMPEDD